MSLVLTLHSKPNLFDPFASWDGRRVQLLAQGVNRLTLQQPWAADLLAQHAGKTFQITWLYSEMALAITDGGQLVPATQVMDPDVVVHIPETLAGIALKKILAPKQDMQANLKVSGDAALAQTLSTLARDLRPDFEDALAKQVGDIPASRIFSGLRGAAAALRSGFQNTQQNVAEYLAYETKTLADKESYLTFRHAVNSLTLKLDKLSENQSGLEGRTRQLSSLKDRPAR